MRKPLNDAFNRLAAAESSFLNNEFLAPVLAGQRVIVRVANIILTMEVEPARYSGWGVFQPRDRTHATLIRPASMLERENYLKLYPKVRLLISGRRGVQWYGRLATDGKVKLTGDAPINLIENVQLFDTVITRFDGGSFWFEAPDTASLRVAEALRDALNQNLALESILINGVTVQLRSLYGELLALRLALLAQEAQEAAREAREAARDRVQERLSNAAAHAGAILLGYRELNDVYTVEYSVDGASHTSVLNKQDLTVQAAGICLSGGDRSFDFQSLVGVIREGVDRRRIVRVGINQGGYDDDEDY